MGKAYVVTKHQFIWILVLQVALIISVGWLATIYTKERQANHRLVLRLTAEYIRMHQEIAEACPPVPDAYYATPIQANHREDHMDDDGSHRL